MSELREVEVPIFENVFKEVCKKLGYTVTSGNIRGYSTGHIQADIVIRIPEGYDIGIVNGKLIYDDWRGIAESHLKKIIPEYMESLLKSRGLQYQKVESKNEVILRVRV